MCRLLTFEIIFQISISQDCIIFAFYWRHFDFESKYLDCGPYNQLGIVLMEEEFYKFPSTYSGNINKTR